MQPISMMEGTEACIAWDVMAKSTVQGDDLSPDHLENLNFPPTRATPRVQLAPERLGVILYSTSIDNLFVIVRSLTRRRQ